jgi:hypothetical protein
MDEPPPHIGEKIIYRNQESWGWIDVELVDSGGRVRQGSLMRHDEPATVDLPGYDQVDAHRFLPGVGGFLAAHRLGDVTRAAH